ncbi:SCO family protein [Pseudogemmatithrix spongiicola]|uniref:SCO family protein n=1 Tax=Pseudogemmatithrix spongiicola TaxID=3062599 RepID=A0AA49JS21_9BACT|nr:SCO family protein [Gemmatimonadaceae bacterium 'strain 138']WKW13845.1 SCO family protein [Gemmatimonadaceae bacterium 'strain 318']
MMSRLMLAAALMLAACSGKLERGIVIEDADPAPALAFTAADGQRFDLAAERGKVVMLYFGYTHCPDVCPTTLSDWARAKRALGADTTNIRFVFVSMDPDRDTPELALTYARQFDGAFVGLTGTPLELEDLKKRWSIAAYPEGDPRDGFYTVAHPAHTFVVDRQGRLRVLFQPGVSGEELAQDLRKLF